MLRRGTTCHVPRCPRPLEIKSANSPVTIEHFTCQKKTGNPFGPHRPPVDFIQRDAARCNFGIVPAAITLDRQFQINQRMNDRAPVVSRKVSHYGIKRHAIVFEDGFGKSLCKSFGQDIDN